jgi:hypothetical protein
MAEVTHDFSSGNDTLTIPATGAAGFVDPFQDCARKDALLKTCHDYLTAGYRGLPRSLWADDDRDLAEKIEAELGMEVRS